MLISPERNTNIDLSFEFYSKALENSLCKFQDLITAEESNLVRREVKNYLFCFYNTNIRITKDFYIVEVGFEMSNLYNQFDFLDFIISSEKLEDKSKLYINNLITRYDSLCFSNRKLLIVCVDNLTNLILKKIIEEYRIKYSLDLNHSSNDFFSKKRHIDGENFVLALFDHENNRESIAEFLEIENKFNRINDSAKFYHSAFNKQLESIYKEYGDKAESFLNSYLNRIMASKISDRKWLLSQLGDKKILEYNTNFFFNVFENIQHFIIDGDFLKQHNTKSLNKQQIEIILNEATRIFGEDCKEKFKQLITHELLLSNLVFEKYSSYKLLEDNELASSEHLQYGAVIDLIASI